MSLSPTILWFRKDLRLKDNSALKASIEAGLPVIPVFIWSPDEAGDWAPGAASKWWLHQALKSLSEALKDKGGEFVLREGDSLGQLRDIIEMTGAKRVYWNRRYESPQGSWMLRSSVNCARMVLKWRVLIAPYLTNRTPPPRVGKSLQGLHALLEKGKDRLIEPIAEPDFDSLKFPDTYPQTLALDSLGLLPEKQWYRKFDEYWVVSEAAAQKGLEKFLSQPVEGYNQRVTFRAKTAHRASHLIYIGA